MMAMLTRSLLPTLATDSTPNADTHLFDGGVR
jgi:hypothetical protein